VTRPDSPSVQSLAERIFNYLRTRPHDPITRKELAEALETAPNNTIFGMALAEARDMASRAGDCITSCTWNATVRASAMRFLPAGKEDGELLVPLFNKSTVTSFHMRTLEREARYGALNGSDETTRQFAAYLESTLSTAGEHMQHARELTLTVMAAVESSREKDKQIAQLTRMLGRQGKSEPVDSSISVSPGG
jgi:hypothetical protein